MASALKPGQGTPRRHEIPVRRVNECRKGEGQSAAVLRHVFPFFHRAGDIACGHARCRSHPRHSILAPEWKMPMETHIRGVADEPVRCRGCVTCQAAVPPGLGVEGSKFSFLARWGNYWPRQCHCQVTAADSAHSHSEDDDSTEILTSCLGTSPPAEACALSNSH